MAQKKLECLPLAGFLTIFGHIYIWCNSNFDGRHSNFFWAIIHLFMHPSLKQISPRITQGSTTTHTEKSIKNPWVTHHYALHVKKQHWTDYLEDMTASNIWMANRYLREPAGDGGSPHIPMLCATNE